MSSCFWRFEHQHLAHRVKSRSQATSRVESSNNTESVTRCGPGAGHRPVELGGETRELAWLIYDRDGPLSVLPLALGAMEIGTAASGAKTASDLEVAQVIHEARAASAIVVPGGIAKKLRLATSLGIERSCIST